MFLKIQLSRQIGSVPENSIVAILISCKLSLQGTSGSLMPDVDFRKFYCIFYFPKYDSHLRTHLGTVLPKNNFVLIFLRQSCVKSGTYCGTSSKIGTFAGQFRTDTRAHWNRTVHPRTSIHKSPSTLFITRHFCASGTILPDLSLFNKIFVNWVLY